MTPCLTNGNAYAPGAHASPHYTSLLGSPSLYVSLSHLDRCFAHVSRVELGLLACVELLDFIKISCY